MNERGVSTASHGCREPEPLSTGVILLPGLPVSTLTMNGDPPGHRYPVFIDKVPWISSTLLPGEVVPHSTSQQHICVLSIVARGPPCLRLLSYCTKEGGGKREGSPCCLLSPAHLRATGTLHEGTPSVLPQPPPPPPTSFSLVWWTNQ